MQHQTAWRQPNFKNLSSDGFLVNEETRTNRSLCGLIDSGSCTTLSSSHLNDPINRENDEDSPYTISLKYILLIVALRFVDYNNESIAGAGPAGLPLACLVRFKV